MISRGILILSAFFLAVGIAADGGVNPRFRPDQSVNRGFEEPRSLYEKINERGQITIALQEDYQPFHISDPREGFPGFDVELGKKIGDALGVRVEFKFLQFPEIMQAAANREVDIALGGISSNLERGRTMAFSDPYLITTPAALLSRRTLPPEPENIDFPRRVFSSLADLKYAGTITIGVQIGTTNELLIKSDPEFARHRVVSFNSRVNTLDALEKGEIDAFVADGLHIKALVTRRKDLLNNYIPLTAVYREEHICIVFSHGNPELWNTLNFILKELRRTGYIDALKKKYFESSGWVP